MQDKTSDPESPGGTSVSPLDEALAEAARYDRFHKDSLGSTGRALTTFRAELALRDEIASQILSALGRAVEAANKWDEATSAHERWEAKASLRLSLREIGDALA